MRRKKVIALLLTGALISGGVALGTEAGSIDDPLITLNWLRSTFIPTTVAAAEAQVDKRMDEFPQQVPSDGTIGVELRAKRGDIFQLASGASLLSLAGSVSVTGDGTVIDLTVGEEVPLNIGSVAVKHRYLTAENTQAVFSITSDTAVIRLIGPYQLIPSKETDYNALAGALKTMGLFRGSDVAYGSGYELESAPTRIQGLIMFLRLLGEDAVAQAYPGSGITFADVPEWALPYAAYAYDRGYIKGRGVDSQWRVVFGASDLLTARDYMTFLLRALGYVEGSDFQWLSAVEDAQSIGVLTAGEKTLLSEKSFLRAQVVYLSYFSLSAKLAGEENSLLDRLINKGTIDSNTASSAMSSLAVERL